MQCGDERERLGELYWQALGDRVLTEVSQRLLSEFARGVRTTITRWRMLARGDRVLLAVSGGPDSTALVEVFAELAAGDRFELDVAHFNHALRGRESDRDQHLVEELCARLGIPCHVERATDPDDSSNVEERARLVRYEFLLRKARELRCRRVATGHTVDDQAETVVMRLLRGSGLDGLAGIRAVRGDGVVRPLIEQQRREILAYLEHRGVSYATDSTNADRRFLRSRVRYEVMPVLAQLNPAVNQALARAAEIAAGDADALQRIAAETARAHTAGDGAIDLSALDDLPTNLRERVLRSWLKEQRGSLNGVASIHLRSIHRLARERQASKEVRLPANGVVVREYRQLRFHAGPIDPKRGFCHPLTPGMALRLEGGWQVAAEMVPSPGEIPSAERTCWYFWADADAVDGVIQVRNARQGDRIRPLGVAGHRKLQDVFVDHKLPRSERWGRPVLEADGRLLWVPGLVRSDHALISPQTRIAWRVAIDVSAVAAGGSLC